MEENTVTAVQQAASETGAPEQATVFAFAPEETGGVALVEETDLPQAEAGDAPSERTDAGGQAAEKQPAEPENGVSQGARGPRFEGRKQAEIGMAFAKANDRLRAKYERMLEQDPDRAIGRRLVEDLMQREHLSEADARKTLDDRFYAAQARRDGIPESLARDIAALKKGAAAQPREPEFDAAQKAAEVQSEMAAMPLPEGFDVEAAFRDPAFSELLMQMPTATAVRLYHAERRAEALSKQAEHAAQDVAEKMQARAQIPVPASPRAPVKASIDYRNLSSEEFWALKRKHDAR